MLKSNADEKCSNFSSHNGYMRDPIRMTCNLQAIRIYAIQFFASSNILKIVLNI